MMAWSTTVPKAATMLTVGIGELRVTADRRQVLVSYGLGSCVALCLWDSVRTLAGMAHVMLPSAVGSVPPGAMPAKFADHAIAALLTEMERQNAERDRLVAKLAGGAHMFGSHGQGDLLAVGKRNIERLQDLLRAHHIPLVAEATGGSAGRTVSFSPATGRLVVKTIGSGEHEI